MESELKKEKEKNEKLKQRIRDLENEERIQMELITSLKKNIQELSSTTICKAEKNCTHYKSLKEVEKELECNLVDSRIKLVDMVDRVNDLEYRNDRLESILVTSPSNITAIIDEIDNSMKIPTKETKKIRQNLVMMRTMSLKMTGNVPQKVPEVVFSDKRTNNDPIFKSLTMKLEEFKRAIMIESEETVSKNFGLLCTYISSTLSALNWRVLKSQFLQQHVSFLRSGCSNTLVNLLGCPENFRIVEILHNIYYSSEQNKEIAVGKTRKVFHPFKKVEIEKVEVVRRYPNKNVLVGFKPKDCKERLDNIMLKRHLLKDYFAIHKRLSHVFRFFNQIWTYKTYLDSQSPPNAPVLQFAEINKDLSGISWIEELTPLSQLNRVKMSDAARFEITYSSAGLIIAYFVIGVRILPHEVFFDKKGKLYLEQFDKILGMPIDEAIRRNSPNLGLLDEKMLIPEPLVEYLGKGGTIELNTTLLAAYINLRKFGNSIISYVKMVFENMIHPKEIENYMSKSLMVKVKREEAITKMKRIIRDATINYKGILESMLVL